MKRCSSLPISRGMWITSTAGKLLCTRMAVIRRTLTASEEDQETWKPVYFCCWGRKVVQLLSDTV